MATGHESTADIADSAPLRRVARGVLLVLWHLVRLPVLATLLALEPVVQLVFAGIAVLGILMSVFFEWIVRLPHFPFGLMIAMSIGSATLLVPYYLLIRLLSDD